MRTPPLVRAAGASFALAAALAVAPPRALADERLPGEAVELTDKVRAEATKHVETLGKGEEKATLAARRALLKLGPVVWPVIENASRLTPPDAARPHMAFLKA